MAGDVDLAYLAGIIDGEGCLRIEKSSTQRTPVTPVLSIANNDLQMIEWVLERFGGNLRTRKTNTYEIYWTGRNATQLLERVLEYLVAKKNQARLVLSFREFVGSPGKRISDDELFVREAMVEALSIMKQPKKEQGGTI